MDSREWWYLAPAIGVGLFVYAVYVATHDFPAGLGGIYLQMVEAVQAHGYGLPERVPNYTVEGIPMAYPPLAFYVYGAINDLTGVAPVTLDLLLPGLVSVLALVPAFLFGRALLGSSRAAGLAAVVLATSPALLSWHIAGDGLVRSLALLWVCIGLYTGLRTFRTGHPSWLVASVFAFGATVLTHPQYAVFFVLSYLVLYLREDRTLAGLRNGLVVGFGGLSLASPWLVTVISRHGVDVFLRASRTHGGLDPNPLTLAAAFLITHLTEMVTLWHALVIVGLAFLLVGRRYALVAWFLATGSLFATGQFVLFVGAFVVGSTVFEALVPALERAWDLGEPLRGRVPELVLAALVVWGAVSGALFVANYPITGAGDPGATVVDADDRDAIRWIRANTDPGDRFLVLGREHEWVPYLANRTTVAIDIGAEWHPPRLAAEYDRFFGRAATCGDVDCLWNAARDLHTAPAYVYVPRYYERIDVSLRYENGYRVVYRNDGVLVLAYEGTSADPGSTVLRDGLG